MITVSSITIQAAMLSTVATFSYLIKPIQMTCSLNTRLQCLAFNRSLRAILLLTVFSMALRVAMANNNSTLIHMEVAPSKTLKATIIYTTTIRHP